MGKNERIEEKRYDAAVIVCRVSCIFLFYFISFPRNSPFSHDPRIDFVLFGGVWSGWESSIRKRGETGANLRDMLGWKFRGRGMPNGHRYFFCFFFSSFLLFMCLCFVYH